MSTISWTSPSPSDNALPTSIETRRPRSSLAPRSASPSWRTNSPRRGAGTFRHWEKADWASAIKASASPGVVSRTLAIRSEEHTSELQSLMRISYAVFCLKKKNHVLPFRHHKCQKQFTTSHHNYEEDSTYSTS